MFSELLSLFQTRQPGLSSGLGADLWDGLTAPQSAKSGSAIGSRLRYQRRWRRCAKVQETHASHDNIVVHASSIFSFSVHARCFFVVFVHVCKSAFTLVPSDLLVVEVLHQLGQ